MGQQNTGHQHAVVFASTTALWWQRQFEISFSGQPNTFSVFNESLKELSQISHFLMQTFLYPCLHNGL